MFLLYFIKKGCDKLFDKEIKNYYEKQDMGNNEITNIKVYGLQNSLRVSGFPMQTSSKDETDEHLLKRGKRLGNHISNSAHDNFLCGITVQFDLCVSVKMWTEFERYHFADIISSQSSMFKIMEFPVGAFNEYTDESVINAWNKLRDNYLNNKTPENYLRVLMSTPVGLRLNAGITTNYRQLKVMYEQRKNHKLPEWKRFCKSLLTLPYFKELTGVEE